MSLAKRFLQKIEIREAEHEREVMAERERLLIEAMKRYVGQKNRESWLKFGFFACPRLSGRPYSCDDLDCLIGTHCNLMAEKGLYGDGTPLPRKQRPRCGARTRAGGQCQVRVEPGFRRCRLHGGLSTGPKTEAGKSRIRAATLKRWKANNESRKSGRGK